MYLNFILLRRNTANKLNILKPSRELLFYGAVCFFNLIFNQKKYFFLTLNAPKGAFHMRKSEQDKLFIDT